MSLDAAVKTYGRSKIAKRQQLRQDELFDAVVASRGSGDAAAVAAASPSANTKAQLGYDPYLFDSDDEQAEAAPPVLSPAWKSQLLLSLKSPSPGGLAKTPKRKQPHGESPGGATKLKKRLTPTVLDKKVKKEKKKKEHQEQHPASAAPASAGRPRGRPPKSPSASSAPTTPRGRGRPPKETTTPSSVESPARPRGRPPKEQQDATTESPAKKRGRPPKQEEESSSIESPAKRRGRPPKQEEEEEPSSIESPAKKRGRPPKQQPDAELSTTDSPAKKRGRPPKQQPDTESSTTDSPAKKRGRPPKHVGVSAPRGRPPSVGRSPARGSTGRGRGRPPLGSGGRSPRGIGRGRPSFGSSPSPRGGVRVRLSLSGLLAGRGRPSLLSPWRRRGSGIRSPRGGGLGRTPLRAENGASPSASGGSPTKRPRVDTPSPGRRGSARPPGRPPKAKDSAKSNGKAEEVPTPKRRGRPPKTPAAAGAAADTDGDVLATSSSRSHSRSPLPSEGDGVQSPSSSATPKRGRGRPPKQAGSGLGPDVAAESPVRISAAGGSHTAVAAGGVTPSPRRRGRPPKQRQQQEDKDGDCHSEQEGEEESDAVSARSGCDEAGTVASAEQPTPADSASSAKRPRGRPPKKPQEATTEVAAHSTGGALDLAAKSTDAASATPLLAAAASAAKRGRGRPPRSAAATPLQAVAGAASTTASDRSSQRKQTTPPAVVASSGHRLDDLSDATVAASTAETVTSVASELSSAIVPSDQDRPSAGKIATSLTVASSGGSSETPPLSADESEADDVIASGQSKRKQLQPVAPAASIFSSATASAPTTEGGSAGSSQQPDNEKDLTEEDDEEEADSSPPSAEGSSRPPPARSKRFVRTPRTKTQAKYSYNPRPWAAADDEQPERQRRPANAAELGAVDGSNSGGIDADDDESAGRSRVAEVPAVFGEGTPSSSATATAESSSSQLSTSHSTSMSQQSSSSASSSQQRARHAADDGDQPRIRKSVTWPTRTGDSAVTSLKVRRACKELYTVVHNVKHASECQESGESQQFDDDLEYLLEGMKDSAAYSTRCLSALSLAAKCASPAFRMHLKAEGTVIHIFQLLQDACSDKGLALCTACVMYMLSRDRLNMDLDKRCLALMVQLLSESAPPSGSDKEYEKVKDKVVSLCCPSANSGSQEMPPVDSDGVLNGADISAAHLAMESLLSLTSRRAGDWFKEELRLLGGLDHIVDAVSDCERSLSAGAKDSSGLLGPAASDRLLKICRCLRVLENVTFLNTENQEYLMSYEDGLIIPSLCNLLTLCEAAVCAAPNAASDSIDVGDGKLGGTVLQTLLAALRLLLNLTHDNVSGIKTSGGDGTLIGCCVRCILCCPQRLPSEQRFDVFVLGLGLLVNLVEHSAENRALLVALKVPRPHAADDSGAEQQPLLDDDTGAVSAICKMFLQRMQAADKLEKEANEVPSAPPVTARSGAAAGAVPADGEELEECVAVAATTSHDDTLTEILHKAGKHMEDSIVAAYAALVLGCLVLGRGGASSSGMQQLAEGKADADSSTQQPAEGEVEAESGSRTCLEAVRAGLPEHNLRPLVEVLQKFLGFIKLTDAASSTGNRSIADVIAALERACC